MNKYNAIVTILISILVVGIIYLTLSSRNSTPPAVDESNLQKPREILQTTPSQNQNAIVQNTGPSGSKALESNQMIKSWPTPPALNIDKTKKYTALLKTTEGNIKVELFADKTPLTVNNFVFLSDEKFYDNTIFHRIISGFMIQGGDPQGTGSGGPGYKFDDEPFEGEYARGTIAMANAGPNTNGSQFFIMHQNYALPKNYVIFGKVVEGLNIVDKIAGAPVTKSQSGEKSKPINPVKITSVEITAQ